MRLRKIRLELERLGEFFPRVLFEFLPDHELRGNEMRGGGIRREPEHRGECRHGFIRLSRLNIGVAEHIADFNRIQPRLRGALEPWQRLAHFARKIIALRQKQDRFAICGAVLGLGSQGLLKQLCGLGVLVLPISPESALVLAATDRRGAASAHCEKAVQLGRGCASAHYHLGVEDWLGQEPDRSIPELEAAVKLRSAEGDYRYRLGPAYNSVGHYDQAVRELAEAAKQQPKNAAIWNELGLAHQKSGDLPKAVESYRRAVELDPKYADARNNL